MNLHFENIWSGFRAETSSPAGVALNVWRYLLKYLLKKRRYKAEEVEWALKCTSILEKVKEESFTGPILKIGLAGDLMWLRREAKSEISPKLTDRMRTADFWIGNLESPILGDQPVNSWFRDKIRFHSSPLLLSGFAHEGKNLFGILSLANNHILDAGSRGIDFTRKYLADENIMFSGTGDEGVIRECNGIRTGFFAATYGINFHQAGQDHGISVIGAKAAFMEKAGRVLRWMEEKGCHLKIISLHWGHEYEFIPAEDQRFLARQLAAAGADIILGHHPHVIQPVEVLFAGGSEKKYGLPPDPAFTIPGNSPRKVLVIYSAGNFITEMLTRECRRGAAYIIGIGLHDGLTVWNIIDSFVVRNKTSLILRRHIAEIENGENIFSNFQLYSAY